jgi:hypothetical protein
MNAAKAKYPFFITSIEIFYKGGGGTLPEQRTLTLS